MIIIIMIKYKVTTKMNNISYIIIIICIIVLKYHYNCIQISDSNETETSEIFFMLVSKQMKPDKVGFETN